MSEIERLRDALRQIAYHECYTRDGEEAPHVRMMKLAERALFAPSAAAIGAGLATGRYRARVVGKMTP